MIWAKNYRLKKRSLLKLKKKWREINDIGKHRLKFLEKCVVNPIIVRNFLYAAVAPIYLVSKLSRFVKKSQ